MTRYSYSNDTNLTLKYCYEQLLNFIPQLTKQDFGKFINLTKQNLSQRMKKGSMLSIKELDLLRTSLQDNEIPTKFLDTATLPPEKSLIQVPVRSEVELSCGTGTYSNADFITDTIGFDVNFIRKLGGYPKTVSIVYAKGDSMEDKISSGDLLMVDESKKYVTDNKIYAFVYDFELYCKKLQKTNDEIVAVSLNSKYQPFSIEKEKPFEVVGQVISVIKKV